MVLFLYSVRFFVQNRRNNLEIKDSVRIIVQIYRICPDLKNSVRFFVQNLNQIRTLEGTHIFVVSDFLRRSPCYGPKLPFIDKQTTILNDRYLMQL